MLLVFAPQFDVNPQILMVEVEYERVARICNMFS